MPQLTKDERRAVVDWAKDRSYSSLKLFLMLNVQDARLEDISAIDLSEVVAMRFTEWLEKRADAVDILRAASADPRTHPSAPGLEAAAGRLAALVQRQPNASQSYEARLVDLGIPIVNRAQLRDYLKTLVEGGRLPVVIVQGDSGLGRSHSWHLIKYVATVSGIAEPQKLDMLDQILEQQTMEFVFKALVRKLRLPAGMDVTVEGVTPTTLGERFAREFAQRLSDSATTRQKPFWLVLDSLDRPLDVPIKSFVQELARAATVGELSDCVLFLLGPDTAFSPIDPYAGIRHEALTPFLVNEITDACIEVNQLGLSRLDQAALDIFLSEVKELATSLRGRDLCKAVGERLVILRNRVKA
jgi:hypothetical protein